MTFQLVAALLIVAVAAGYLAARARAILLKKKAGGCGACSACPAGAPRSTATPNVVSIGRIAVTPPRPAGGRKTV